MLRICRYSELSAMCQHSSSQHQLSYSTSSLCGRLHGHEVIVIFSDSVSSSTERQPAFSDWLQSMGQLQHPHVLPLLGACLDPPAVIMPLMQVCNSFALPLPQPQPHMLCRNLLLHTATAVKPQAQLPVSAALHTQVRRPDLNLELSHCCIAPHIDGYLYA